MPVFMDPGVELTAVLITGVIAAPALLLLCCILEECTVVKPKGTLERPCPRALVRHTRNQHMEGDLELSEQASNGHGCAPQLIGARHEEIDKETPAPPHIELSGARDSTSRPLPRVSEDVVLSGERPPKTDGCQRSCRLARSLVTVFGISSLLVMLCVSLARPSQAINNDDLRTNLLSTMFACGLAAVALEDLIGMNKSAVMMGLAATMWTFLAATTSKAAASKLHHHLNRGLEDVGSVILFLLPAMGLVESVDHFEGFEVVTRLIQRAMAGKKERLMPIICLLTFLLSSVIDNLTATIVAVKLLKHLVSDDKEWRRNCGGSVVIAANAGGAWSPIGDVTTTMLWIQGKITATQTVSWLLLPSFMAGAVPLAGIWWRAQETTAAGARQLPFANVKERLGRRHFSELREDSTGRVEQEPLAEETEVESHGPVTVSKVLALVLGIFFILLVPVLKSWTGLPPYLGMLLALGLYWLVTDALGMGMHGEEGDGETSQVGVVAALHKVDLTGLFFFTGVLLAVGALDSAGVLTNYAKLLVRICGPSPLALCTLLGISSAIVDNVPLVEAAIDMFREKPADHPLWQLVALTAGTGGSILSIGSIAGVTLMSMEGVGFLWYCKRITVWAALGFTMGIVTYKVERLVFS